MIYPNGCIIQTYNVSSGQVIQAPCFFDQDEPPEGFRSVIFGGVTISTDEINFPRSPNQTGPAFVIGKPAAVDFNLTSLINANLLSRVRSITVQFSAITSPGDCVVRLNSGYVLPGIQGVQSSDGSRSASFASGDFLSAEPIFSLQSNGFNTYGGVIIATITVSNFRTGGYWYPNVVDPLNIS